MRKIFFGAIIVLMVLVGTSCEKNSSGVGSTTPSADASTAVSATEEASVASESTTAETTEAAVTPSADKDTIILEGTIGDIAVHMRLKIKDSKVSGSYYYDKVKQDIKLEGAIEANSMIYINELDEAGNITGKFDGWYTPGIRLTGSWTDAKTDKMLEFNLNIIDGIPSDAIWAGEWERMDTGRFYSATLVIYNETKSSFEFQLDAFNGANMGFTNGTALIDGTKARYEDKSVGSVLTFNLQNGLIDLTANDAANGQAGAGVVFDGKYTKGELPEDTLLRMGYVSSKEQDESFHAMVGEDYALFLNTANLPEDAEDLDDLGAVVTTWWVHGFPGAYESIVMFLPDGKLCAAVIDPDSNTIKVYTNADYITTIPETIRAWSDNFPEMTVEFQH